MEPAWDIERIIAGDEAHYNDIFTGENVSCAFKNSVKVTALIYQLLSVLISNYV